MASKEMEAAFEKLRQGIESLARVSFQCGWCERPNAVDSEKTQVPVLKGLAAPASEQIIDAMADINSILASELATIVREIAHEQLEDPEAFIAAMAKRITEEKLGVKL